MGRDGQSISVPRCSRGKTTQAGCCTPLRAGGEGSWSGEDRSRSRDVGGVWAELKSDSCGISLLEAFVTHALQSLSTGTRRRIMFEQKDFQSFSKSFGVFLNNFIS